MKLPSVRLTNIFVFSVASLLLCFAAYLQIEMGQEPCPLCILQRLTMLILALLFLIGGTVQLQNKSKQWFHLTITLIACLGMAAAGRQVWLQHLPVDQIPPCGPSLYYLLENLPLLQSLAIIVHGTGECAAVTWRFLTLSIPEWTLIFFFLFAAISIWQAFREE